MNIFVIILLLVHGQPVTAQLIGGASSKDECYSVAAGFLKANEQVVFKKLAEIGDGAGLDIVCAPMPEYNEKNERLNAKGVTKLVMRF